MTSKQRRIASFIRLARECSRDSWQHSQSRAAFLAVKAQAMTEARRNHHRHQITQAPYGAHTTPGAPPP